MEKLMFEEKRNLKMSFKTVAVILVLASVVFSIQNFGYYNNRFSIEAKNYVLQLPQNLGIPASINKEYSISLLPSIKINGASVTIIPPVQTNILSKPKSMLNLKVVSTKQSMRVDEKVRIEEDKISSEVTLKNEGREDKKVSIYFPLGAESKRTIFIADNYKNNSHYLILTSPELRGNSLGVSFSDEINLRNQKASLINTSDYAVNSREMLLKKGQSYHFKVIYYPFNLEPSEKTKYSPEESIYLESLYVKVIGEPSLSNESSTDPITEILSKLSSFKKTGDGSFLIEHNVNIKNLEDSLDFSMYFKKAAEEKGIPARLVIGKKENKRYAWVQVYFGGWKEIDAFEAKRGEPRGWKVIFTEPELKLSTIASKGNKEKNLYEATKWLKKTQENNFLLYLSFLIILTITILGFVNLKSGSIEKRFRKTEIEKQELEGKYRVLKTDEVKKEFINEILKEIIKQQGVVDLSQLAEKFHYSKELISFAVAYLIDNKYLAKENQKGIQQNKKVQYSLKQKIAIGAISTAAIILIIYLLIS